MRTVVVLLFILLLLAACSNSTSNYPEELTAEDVAAMRGDPDFDGVIFDNCMYVSNADQADFNTDGVGDACHCDLDRDGKITSYDIELIKDQLYTIAEPLDIYDPNADVDGDGMITRADIDLCIAACTTNCSL